MQTPVPPHIPSTTPGDDQATPTETHTPRRSLINFSFYVSVTKPRLSVIAAEVCSSLRLREIPLKHDALQEIDAMLPVLRDQECLDNHDATILIGWAVMEVACLQLGDEHPSVPTQFLEAASLVMRDPKLFNATKANRIHLRMKSFGALATNVGQVYFGLVKDSSDGSFGVDHLVQLVSAILRRPFAAAVRQVIETPESERDVTYEVLPAPIVGHRLGDEGWVGSAVAAEMRCAGRGDSLRDLLIQGLVCYTKTREDPKLRNILIDATREEPWTFVSDSETFVRWRLRGRGMLRTATLRGIAGSGIKDLTVPNLLALLQGLDDARGYAAFAAYLHLPAHLLNPEPPIGTTVPAAASIFAAAVGSLGSKSEGTEVTRKVVQGTMLRVIPVLQNVIELYDDVVGPDPEPKKKRAAVSEEPSSPVALPTAYPESPSSAGKKQKTVHFESSTQPVSVSAPVSGPTEESLGEGSSNSSQEPPSAVPSPSTADSSPNSRIVPPTTPIDGTGNLAPRMPVFGANRRYSFRWNESELAQSPNQRDHMREPSTSRSVPQPESLGSVPDQKGGEIVKNNISGPETNRPTA